ncbi:hypothetical protein NDI49_26680 [Trichocoleus sp. ST-U3]
MCFNGFAHAELHSGLGESVFGCNVGIKIEEENPSFTGYRVLWFDATVRGDRTLPYLLSDT